MSQFVSQHIFEWLLLLVGGALFFWTVARLYQFVRPPRQRRQSLHSDRRKTPRVGGRRQIDEP